MFFKIYKIKSFNDLFYFISVSGNFSVPALKLIIIQRSARASAWSAVDSPKFFVSFFSDNAVAVSSKVLNCSSIGFYFVVS